MDFAKGANLRLQVVNQTRELRVPAYEAECLRADVIRALLGAGVTIFLTPQFVQEEAHRMDGSNKEWPDAQLAAALRSSVTNGAILWQEIDRIQKQFSAVAKPWIISPADRTHMKIAGPSEDQMPTLEIVERWKSEEYQKQLPVSLNVGGKGGRNPIWNLAVTIRLADNGKTLVDRSYPPSEWQATYKNADSPANHTRNRVMNDIAVGLQTQEKKDVRTTPGTVP